MTEHIIDQSLYFTYTYMLSLTENVSDFQHNTLWDAHQHAQLDKQN